MKGYAGICGVAGTEGVEGVAGAIYPPPPAPDTGAEEPLPPPVEPPVDVVFLKSVLNLEASAESEAGFAATSFAKSPVRNIFIVQVKSF